MVFLSQKVEGNMVFTDYWKVLVFNLSVMGNTVFFWVQKLMKRWYLWLLRSSCFEPFGDEKYSLFFSQKIDKKMIFSWSFWAFYDIPGPGKYGFLHSVLAEGLVNMLAKSLVNMLAKSLLSMLAERLVNMLAEVLVITLAETLVNVLVKVLVSMLTEALMNIHVVWVTGEQVDLVTDEEVGLIFGFFHVYKLRKIMKILWASKNKSMQKSISWK